MSAFQEQTNQYVEQIKAGANSILVAVRVRPLSQKQRKISTFETVKVLQGKLLSLAEPESWSPVDILRKNRSKEIQYAFDYVFDQQVSTRKIYQDTVSILLEGLLEGYNASVLAYGATSCGKTFTMIGENENSPGIMAMTVLELLNMASQTKKYQDIKIKASYVEIYNENIKDLLISEDRNLDIREDPKEGVSIAGVTQVLVDNINQLKTVLKVGNRNRTMESTGCNQVSSRSHGIFQISLEIKNKAQSTIDQTMVSKLFLIDLAGSQRASNTTNKGIRMVEGAKINQSLLVLGNCIQALSDASQKGLKNAFVPYRGSKLTRLLKDSLGGNCRTVMIAHIAPAVNLFEETYNTLVYAHRAKNIKNNPIRNTLVAETHLSNYVNVINNLKRENQQLKIQIRQKQLNKLQKERNSPQKYSNTLPAIDSPAYNQQISKYETIILKQFSEEDVITEKINDLEMKIQKIAFVIFEKQMFKADEKLIKAKDSQAAQLSKEKLKLQKKLEQKIQARSNIIREIEKNQIIGTTGVTHLKNSFKQKKVESALKLLKAKEEIIQQQKKQMDTLMKKIKSSMKNKDDVIQKQKVLIKKNNIISRITYSQLDFTDNNEELSVQTERKSEQKYRPKPSSMSYKKLKPVEFKRKSKQDNSKSEFSLTVDVKEEKSIIQRKNNKKDTVLNNENNENSGRDNKRNIKFRDTIDQEESNIIPHLDSNRKKQRKSKSPSPSPSPPHQKIPHKKSSHVVNKLGNLNNSSNRVIVKSKSTRIQPKFDFVYLPH